MVNLRLSIQPIPASSQLATLAQLLPRARWNRIRQAVYRRAGHHCQICGRQGRLHCHEVWQYNGDTSHQWLRGFQALCADCHNVKHILFVRDSRRRIHLLQHFAAVNRLSFRQAEQHLAAARRRQQQLNRRVWIVSFGDYNWSVPALKGLEQRRAYVRSATSYGAG